MRPPQFEGLDSEIVATDKGTTQFDLTLFLWEEGTARRPVRVRRALFDTTTIEPLRARLHRLVESIVTDPHRPLRELDLLPAG